MNEWISHIRVVQHELGFCILVLRKVWEIEFCCPIQIANSKGGREEEEEVVGRVDIS